MEVWESFLRKLIQPQITEMHLERGRELRGLLEVLSKYPFDPVKKIKNIRENEDLPRDEIRGASQRYIYGNFVDSIIWSCFSIEFGLLVRLDDALSDTEKKVVPKPFTLARIIEWAHSFSVLDEKSRNAAKEILKLRNTHIHGSNFIAALILSYQSSLRSMEKVGIGVEVIERGLDVISALMPKGAPSSLLGRYEPSEIVEAFKTIQSLSIFEWCADKKAIKEVEKEVDNIIANVTSDLLQGKAEKLRKYDEDYLLRERALRAIRNAQKVLEAINIL